MRRVLIVFLLVMVAAAHAQTQKPPASQDPVQAMGDRLTEHFVRKNGFANRWNDQDISRSALYDLIIMYPGNDSLLYALAADYYGNQKYISAVLVAQDILTRSPKHVEARELAAAGFEALKINDKALTNYETLYLQTSSTVALYKMATLQYDLKKFEEAKTNVDILLTKSDIETMKVTLTDSERKTKDYSLKVSLLNLKGLLAQQAGDKAGAKKAFEESLALAPDFVPARQNLAKLK